MDHFWQSCCLIVSHLFLRFQGWSYTSRATGKIPDVQGYLVVYVINSDREYFFSWKVWLKLMYSCGIQFGLADKSLPMHPLFSQWHIKKDLNTEHSVTWERALGYWLSFLSRIVVHLLSVPGLFAFVSVAHAGHVTREKLETGRNCGQ